MTICAALVGFDVILDREGGPCLASMGTQHVYWNVQSFAPLCVTMCYRIPPCSTNWTARARMRPLPHQYTHRVTTTHTCIALDTTPRLHLCHSTCSHCC